MGGLRDSVTKLKKCFCFDRKLNFHIFIHKQDDQLIYCHVTMLVFLKIWLPILRNCHSADCRSADYRTSVYQTSIFRRGVSEECQTICQGLQFEPTSSIFTTCASYIGNIMMCLEEGEMQCQSCYFGTFHLISYH